jgi:ATP adenylyltransferase
MTCILQAGPGLLPAQVRGIGDAFNVNYEQLWAPWRLTYVTGDDKKSDQPSPGSPSLLAGADPSCFLCQAAVCGDARGRLVVQQGPLSLTLLNRYPYNNGHLLVAPKRHLARLDQLDPAEQLDLVQVISQMVGLLERTIRAEGFNVGLNLGQVAGAGLPGHVHWHIVPRWHGDTNFMPALAGIRVIPQSLTALWELLTQALGTAVNAQ